MASSRDNIEEMLEKIADQFIGIDFEDLTHLEKEIYRIIKEYCDLNVENGLDGERPIRKGNKW